MRWIAFAVLILIPFRYLEKFPILLWDESRRAVSTIEMLENGNYLIPHFLGSPDMWGTKPPILNWLQALGINELALRLPSALAAISLVLLLVFFSKRAFQSFWPGMFAGLIMMSSFIFFQRAWFYDRRL